MTDRDSVAEPLPKEKRAEVTTATLIDRLRDRCYASPDPLLEQAADELARLRGEVTLWRSAATLTPDERRVMVPLFAISEAEIDALEYVVVEGRIACMGDYGILRSLLVRLRPEWATSGDLGLRPEEGELRNGSLDGRETVQ
jgi:hypothetical protein